MNLLSFALDYNAAGLVVIPFTKAANGRVSFPAWEKYRSGQTASDINALFGRECDGMALVCVNGIECIDIDVKHDGGAGIDKAYFEGVKQWQGGPEILKKCCLQKTKSNGWHLIYKTDIHQGNTKLAKLKGGKEAVIETRGVGGLVYIHPSPGYTVLNGSLTNLQKLEDNERMTLFCEAVNHNYVERHETHAAITKQAQQHIAEGVTPWDDYNEKTDIVGLLESAGWRVLSTGKRITLTKPGSRSGDVHATIITAGDGTPVFYPFTTATEFEAEKCYNAFAVYATLAHRGDRSAAAKDLYQQGFGARTSQIKGIVEQAPKVVQIETAAVLPDLIAKTEGTKFDIHAPLTEEEAVLQIQVIDRAYKLGNFGQIGVFMGHEKSGKSFVLSCVAAAFLSATRECLNFNIAPLNQKILWFDTEQSAFFYQVTQRRIAQLAGISYNAENYAAYHLRSLQPDERVEVIEHYIYNTPDLGVVIIDGYIDLLNDYNDLKESRAMMNRIMRWSDEKKVLIMGVLHLNKGDGKLRGHFGSEFKNKCDFAINVTKTEGGDYDVTNPICRFAQFPLFQFSRDDDGMPKYQHFPFSGNRKAKTQIQESEIPF